MIWVASLKFMRSLQGIVKSESITYEAWQTVKDVATAVGEFLLGTGAFVVGLLHGALESVWDIFVGLKDLAVMAWDLVKWLFGLITGDSKGLFDSLKGINWGELVQGWIDDFVAKWDNESILKRWHFRGWVIGYAIAEVLMLIFSAGIIQGIKWVGKSAKVAKVISKLPKIAKLAEAAKASKASQKFLKVLQATKGTLGAATKTVKKVVLSGGRIAVKGFIFAAKGIYRVGGKILRGTWSVAEKTIGKVAKKFYYFYDDAAKVLKLIPKKIANIFCKCTNCSLTKAGKSLGKSKRSVRGIVPRNNPNLGWSKGKIPCFPAGTLVSTPEGSHPIEQLQAGDTLYAYDFHFKTVVISKVLSIYRGSTSCWVDVYIDSDILRTTRQHPIWIESEQTWIEAAKLVPGMIVRLQNDSFCKVTHIELLPQLTMQETYNLNVEKTNNFFAGFK